MKMFLTSWRVWVRLPSKSAVTSRPSVQARSQAIRSSTLDRFPSFCTLIGNFNRHVEQ